MNEEMALEILKVLKDINTVLDVILIISCICLGSIMALIIVGQVKE